jgi:CIC family chloride channel protein
VQVSVVKALASALTIGSGGSVGREGPIVQIGSALGLAGPFFAMELILRDFAIESFGAVVLASVTASVVGRAVLGNGPFLDLPPFTLRNPLEYLLFVVLGLLVGACGVLFTRVLYWIEDLCDRLWRGPEWLCPAVGGVFLGGLLLPQMYGVGTRPNPNIAETRQCREGRCEAARLTAAARRGSRCPGPSGPDWVRPDPVPPCAAAV